MEARKFSSHLFVLHVFAVDSVGSAISVQPPETEGTQAIGGEAVV